MKKITFYVFASILLLLVSCTIEDSMVTSNDLDDKNIIEKEVLKEVSLLIGKTLQNSEIRGEISSIVDEIDSYGNAISFAFLFQADERLPKYELRKIAQLDENSGVSTRNVKEYSLFRTELSSILRSNKEDFVFLSNHLEQYSQSSSNNKTTYSINQFNDIESFLVENELELYFPYKENFDWNALIEYTITFEDNNPDESYEGFNFNGLTYDDVYDIVDDYLYENPTIAIIPINKDYIGEDLRITIGDEVHYLDPKQSAEQIFQFYKDNIFAKDLADIINDDDDDDDEVSLQRLTKNINPYTFFNENHLLTTYIPKVRITTRKWKRTLSKAHRTQIARAATDVQINPDGSYGAFKNVIYFDFDLSKRDLKKKRWKDVGLMFDSNWHKPKASQQLIVFTKRKNKSRKEVNVDVKLKLDKDGNYTPESSVNHKITVQSGSKAIFRGNTELHRDHVLSTVVGGAEYDRAVYNQNGIDLSVRRVGEKFEYFFDHYYINY